MNPNLVERVAAAIEQPFLPHGYELKPHLLKSAATAAITVMSDEVEGWQPIESAKEGWENEVDLWFVYDRGGAERITNCRASLSNGKPDWHMRSDEMGWTRLVGGNPTHWRPLPQPPRAALSKDSDDA